MRRLTLALLLAALLLSGCGSTEPTEPSKPAPTETTVPPTEPVTLLTETEGSINTYALDSGSCAGILRMGEYYALLTAGGQIYLLSGDDLQVDYSHTLGCQLSSDDPSILVKDDQISYYDAQRGAYVTLGKNMTEISAMTIQDDMIAGPLMAPDFSTIYYCTDTGIRAMDMATGNSRLLRQEHQRIISLDGLLFDGSILRYTRRISEDETETCFIRTSDGSQSYLADLDGQLTTWDDSYAAVMRLELPMKDFCQIMTGSVDSSPQAVAVENDWADAQFPGEGALLLQTLTDSGLRLELYDLTAGTIVARATLDDRREIYPHAWMDGENLWLWDGADSRFCRWHYQEDAVQEESVLIPQYTLENPDQSAMEQVEQRMQALEETYGIDIRIAESGNRTTGVNYSDYPDYRPEQYLAVLDLLEETMQQFPEGLFAKLDDAVIELVDDFDPAMGIQPGTGSLEIGEETVIRVSICPGLQPIFYHELFHAMELEIQNRTERLSNWSDLNPNGLEYTGSYTAYESGELADSEFLGEGENAVADAYALISPREDRAQTFMYAMMEGEEGRFQSPVMQSKLASLSDAIRRAFGWRETETTFPWEQYISK